MDKNKICFVYNVQDEKKYEESLKYINELFIPEGFQLTILRVGNSANSAIAFNEAMLLSDAKYKIYIEESTCIIDKYFLYSLLDVFKSNKHIGMIGALGARQLPGNYRWLESNDKIGSFYIQSKTGIKLVQYSTSSLSFEEAVVVDRSIMATQYDIPFNEINSEYDLEHSIRFIEKGYKIGVIVKKQPYMILDRLLRSEVTTGFERNVMRINDTIHIRKNNSSNLPLVSILIPTYNRPKYLELALESALNQTYENIEIIIGDDSTDSLTETIIKEKYLPYYNNIKYIKNEKNLGQFENDLNLIELANGEYVNFLMDDDLFHPEKIKRMMKYYLEDKSQHINLVTSHRRLVDENGILYSEEGLTKKVFSQDTVLDGKKLGDLFLKYNFNYMGEPTTVLFRKKDLYEPFGTFLGRKYGCNIDSATWLTLLSQGKGVYISDTLSYFRVHDNQQLQSDKMKIMGASDYAHQVLFARSKGYLQNDQDYEIALNTCLEYGLKILKGNFNLTDINVRHQYNELEKYLNYINKEVDSINNKKRKQIEANLPLVSILIPAYNQTQFLKPALESAINQTYPNIEIIIGDDSTNNEVEEFLKPYLREYKNVSYFKNKPNSFDYGYENHVNSIKKSNGEYINFLNHDDILHHEKIEKMMKCFFDQPNISLVTSARQPIDENGNELPLNGAFSKIFDQDTVISGYNLKQRVLSTLTNFIGEPTTVLFKRKYIEGNQYAYFNEKRFFNLTDLATWFTLLQYGDAVYLADVLSYFRIHSNQNSQKKDIYLNGVVDWYQLIKSGYQTGLITNDEEYRQLLVKWFTIFLPTLGKPNEPEVLIETDLKQKIENTFKEAIHEIFNHEPEFKFQCSVCNKELEKFIPYQYQNHRNDFTNKFEIIGSDLVNFTCPECFSHDRTRHLIMYFDRLNIWEQNIVNKRILHIAPETHLQDIISKIATQSYVCGDLYPANNTISKMDITNIQFQNDYFDFIMCNHVLEHVPDDIKAMKELYRVLKPGGYAVLQTPYSPVIESSFEDKNINTKIKRKKFFGQDDHVRVYGLDFFQRLESAGFKLGIIKNDEVFTEEECEKFGVNKKENLLLVTKSI